MFSPDKVVFEETIAQTSRVCQNHTVTFHSESWGSRPHQRANADSQRESERTPSLCYIRPSRLWTCSSSGWQRAGPQEARLTLREWVRPLIWVSVRGREQGDLPAQTSTSTDSDSLNTRKFHENYKKGMIGKQVLLDNMVYVSFLFFFFSRLGKHLWFACSVEKRSTKIPNDPGIFSVTSSKKQKPVCENNKWCSSQLLL